MAVSKRGPVPPFSLKKGANAPFFGEKGVPAKKMIPKCTDQDFLWYRYGKYQEIPTDTNRKIQFNIQLYSFPIISGLATLITHLGGEEISVQERKILTHQAKDNALELNDASMPLKMPSLPSVVTTRNAPPPHVPQDPILPPIKSSLKTGKFHPVIASTPPPCQTKSTSADPDDEEDDPGIYSKTINRVGDGTHLITASFMKTNDKIRDQLLKDFVYFFNLMHAINGLKIHSVSTKKPLPILTSPKDKNIPTTDNKIRDYFIIQNQYSLVPKTCSKPKAPPQRVDSNGCFQFNENRQYDGPDRITGIMLISVPGNVKQAIGDLLIELKGDAHQIQYKPTQQKNSKAEKMFPGIPSGLCNEGIMHSIRHGLKTCEKTLCNAKRFTIKANMD
jgi:hypothetical protein